MILSHIRTTFEDPPNRRLIWTLIQKMKEAGKCVILTTHFLEEADILSDRIAIMGDGQLQTYGTPYFLKHHSGILIIHYFPMIYYREKTLELEYRLFIDKQEGYNSDNVTRFIGEHILEITLERESSSELVYGVKRGMSRELARFIHVLDQQCQHLNINGYDVSMTTIEEVFLRSIHFLFSCQKRKR